MTPTLIVAFVGAPLTAAFLSLIFAHYTAHNLSRAAIQIAIATCIFGAAGPLFAWLVFMLLYEVPTLLASAFFDTLKKLSFFLVMSYIVGFFPAMLTGVLVGAIRPWLSTWPIFLAAGIVGALFSALAAGTFFNSSGPSFLASINYVMSGNDFVFPLAVAGFFASLGCACLLTRRT